MGPYKAPAGENFEARVTGKLNAATAGDYQFKTWSDDGSWVYINDNLIVNNQGCHGLEMKSGTVTLTQGTHDYEARFTQGGGGQAWILRIQAPGDSEQDLTDAHFAFPDDVTSCVENPPDIARSASSVLGSAPPGTGANLGMLNSAGAWTASTADANQWYEMYLGGIHSVSGVQTQGLSSTRRSGGYQYIGCFKDDNTRDLKHGIGYGHNPASCQGACSSYPYFGLQDGGDCKCDNTYATPSPPYTQVGDGECNKGGTGMGGGWRNAVYKTMSDGYVKKYTVRSSTDGASWSNIQGGAVFIGNSDSSSMVTNSFTAVSVRYVRIYPTEWEGSVSMRAGVVCGSGGSTSGGSTSGGATSGSTTSGGATSGGTTSGGTTSGGTTSGGTTSGGTTSGGTTSGGVGAVAGGSSGSTTDSQSSADAGLITAIVLCCVALASAGVAGWYFMVHKKTKPGLASSDSLKSAGAVTAADLNSRDSYGEGKMTAAGERKMQAPAMGSTRKLVGHWEVDL